MRLAKARTAFGESKKSYTIVAYELLHKAVILSRSAGEKAVPIKKGNLMTEQYAKDAFFRKNKH